MRDNLRPFLSSKPSNTTLFLYVSDSISTFTIFSLPPLFPSVTVVLLRRGTRQKHAHRQPTAQARPHTNITASVTISTNSPTRWSRFAEWWSDFSPNWFGSDEPTCLVLVLVRTMFDNWLPVSYLAEILGRLVVPWLALAALTFVVCSCC